jgi:hypothetical protein
MKDIQKLKDELFDAWEKYHSFSTEKTNFITSLNNDVKELLKIALIQKITLQVQSGLFLDTPKETFDVYLNEIGKDNLIWFCDVFIEEDGSISNDKNKNNFYLEFERYCVKNSIDSKELIDEYKKIIVNLPFFPIYDQIFIQELSKIDKTNDGLKLAEDLNNKELQGFEKMWFHLGSLGKTLLGGILLLILFGLVTSLAKIGTYLSR